MPRARKRHVQQQLKLTRGGKRRGAGRPPKGPRSSERHKKRAVLKKHEPVHAIIRATPEIETLRLRVVYHAIRKALVTTFTREDFRIVHLSIQGTHVHLLVEAANRTALSGGMQAFQISAAKHINAALSKHRRKRRRGTVFIDRYHAVILRSPRQTRNALAYVLNNWRKHRADRVFEARDWRVDPFSSAVSFDGWRDLGVPTTELFPDHYEPLPVWQPKTWLLGTGWRMHGLIRPTEVPSEKSVAVE
jgi:putative transposase